MAFGLGRLGWEPDAFWRATPRELAAAFGSRSGGGAMRRADLLALMARCPDRGSGPSNAHLHGAEP